MSSAQAGSKRIGDAAEIGAKRLRKKKTDREDARHILRLLLKDDFPRIWVANWENRDLRQLLWHRHRMVQTRTRLPRFPNDIRRTRIYSQALRDQPKS